MKSIKKQIERFSDRMNKKGQAGGTVGVVLGVLGSVFVGVLFIMLLLYAVGVINVPGLFAAGSLNANATTSLSQNLTETANQFGGRLPTIGVIAITLIIIAMIVLLVLYLGRMRQSVSGGAGGSAI